jgi:hypothetical protein
MSDRTESSDETESTFEELCSELLAQGIDPNAEAARLRVGAARAILVARQRMRRRLHDLADCPATAAATLDHPLE